MNINRVVRFACGAGLGLAVSAWAQTPAPTPPAAPAAAAKRTAPSASAPKSMPEPSGCLVAEFKTLSLSQPEVQARSQAARDWLRRNLARCTPEQLSAVRSNSPLWLGTALTPEIGGQIEGAIEARISGNPALMGALYESVGKEGKERTEVYRNPTPRAPLVQRMDMPAVLSGAINSGNVTGPSTSVVTQTGNQNQGASQSPGAAQVGATGNAAGAGAGSAVGGALAGPAEVGLPANAQ